MPARELVGIALALFMTIPTPSVRAEPRCAAAWRPDEAAHFGVSAGAAFALYAASTPYLEDPGVRALAGGGAALAVGAAKELLDLAGAGDPSSRDMAWNVVGVAVGVGVAVTLDLLLRELRR